jgi:hypothetical protein
MYFREIAGAEINASFNEMVPSHVGLNMNQGGITKVIVDRPC